MLPRLRDRVGPPPALGSGPGRYVEGSLAYHPTAPPPPRGAVSDRVRALRPGPDRLVLRLRGCRFEGPEGSAKDMKMSSVKDKVKHARSVMTSHPPEPVCSGCRFLPLARRLR